MSKRFFAFFSNHRAAVAMDEQSLENGGTQLTFALALCNNRDHFNRRTARSILSGRLDDRLAGNRTRLTFQEKYDGQHSRKDVMSKVMDAMRDLPEERSYPSIRNFKSSVALKIAGFRMDQEDLMDAIEQDDQETAQRMQETSA